MFIAPRNLKMIRYRMIQSLAWNTQTHTQNMSCGSPYGKLLELRPNKNFEKIRFSRIRLYLDHNFFSCSAKSETSIPPSIVWMNTNTCDNVNWSFDDSFSSRAIITRISPFQTHNFRFSSDFKVSIVWQSFVMCKQMEIYIFQAAWWCYVQTTIAHIYVISALAHGRSQHVNLSHFDSWWRASSPSVFSYWDFCDPSWLWEVRCTALTENRKMRANQSVKRKKLFNLVSHGRVQRIRTNIAVPYNVVLIAA